MDDLKGILNRVHLGDSEINDMGKAKEGAHEFFTRF